MQKRCILCADPDPELRSNLGFLLAGENCVLEEAAGGATLLTQLRRSTDLVILPQQLPDMSGFDACTALRRAVRCAGAVLAGEGGRERQDPVLLRGRG